MGDGGDEPGPGPGPGGGGDGPGMCEPVPEDGAECAEGTDPCLSGTTFCRCRQGEWSCNDFGGGEGGGGPGGFGAECPDNAADGDECEGFGPCTGQTGCSCQQGEVNCQ
jgi:hypothetical protein